MELFADLDKNETYYVVTGDVRGYTTVAPADRQNLIGNLRSLIEAFPEAKDAQIFRGDSFQILFTDPLAALMRSIQIRCWLKRHIAGDIKLDARIAIGAGTIDFFSRDVLASDGVSFQLSERGLNSMKGDEFLKIASVDKDLNEFFDIICMLMDSRITHWTRGHAEAIFWLLDGKTQQQIANELGVGQPAIHNRLKFALWKEFESTLEYIAGRLENIKGQAHKSFPRFNDGQESKQTQ